MLCGCERVRERVHRRSTRRERVLEHVHSKPQLRICSPNMFVGRKSCERAALHQTIPIKPFSKTSIFDTTYALLIFINQWPTIFDTTYPLLINVGYRGETGFTVGSSIQPRSTLGTRSTVLRQYRTMNKITALHHFFVDFIFKFFSEPVFSTPAKCDEIEDCMNENKTSASSRARLARFRLSLASLLAGKE